MITRSVLSDALAILGAALIPIAQGAPQSFHEEALPATIEFHRDIRPVADVALVQEDRPAWRSTHAIDRGQFAFVPGDPARSLTVQRITATSPAVRMPMGKEALRAREVELIRRWLEQEAVRQKQWS